MLRLRAASRVQWGAAPALRGHGAFTEPRGRMCALFDTLAGIEFTEVGGRETRAFFETTPFEPTDSEREDDALRAFVRALDQHLCAPNQENAAYNFAVSVELLACFGPHVALAHVGTTIAFAVRDQQLEQLTFAHNLPREFQRLGSDVPEAYASPRYRTVVVNAIGPSFRRDANTTRRVDTVLLPAVQGDRYVLVTPGITDVLEPSLIEATLCEHPDDELACEALVRAALDAGSREGISVVVATLVRA
ncbi:MAG: hypothetical protein JNK05_20780 [Myxococcales bacterium]|nr:hypothetical protein [Myxococcales bacterium]